MVLLPVDSGPITTIFLSGGMLKFVSPGNIAHNSKDQKNHVLKTRKNKMFIKVEGNGREIGDNPPGPVFQLLLVHQPHPGEGSTGGKAVRYRHRTIGKTTEQKIQDGPAGKEKCECISPI